MTFQTALADRTPLITQPAGQREATESLGKRAAHKRRSRVARVSLRAKSPRHIGATQPPNSLRLLGIERKSRGAWPQPDSLTRAGRHSPKPRGHVERAECEAMTGIMLDAKHIYPCLGPDCERDQNAAVTSSSGASAGKLRTAPPGNSIRTPVANPAGNSTGTNTLDCRSAASALLKCRLQQSPHRQTEPAVYAVPVSSSSSAGNSSVKSEPQSGQWIV